MNLRDLYFDYEELLIGKISTFPTYHFVKNNADYNNKIVFALIRYVVENILHWTPSEAKDLFSDDIAATFKIAPLMEQYLTGIPTFLSSQERTAYLMSLVYPGSVKFSVEKFTLATYSSVLNDADGRWPANFFGTSQLGRDRAEICLRYCIERYLVTMTIEELYRLFAQTAKAKTLLRSYKLDKICEKLYLSPLEYLQISLGEMADPFWYSYYRFAKGYAVTARIMRRGEIPA